MGGVRVVVREGRRSHAEEVHRAAQRGIHCPWGSYDGAAACLLLEEGKACQDKQSWELGMSWKGSSGRW